MANRKMKMNIEADLHCHTNMSDGLMDPAEVVRIAAQKGLSALAITDHDTIQGFAEGKKAALQYNIDFIPGIEINTDWCGREVHILGYGIDPESREFNHKLAVIRDKRKERINKIVEKLRGLGLDISIEEVESKGKGVSIGRPHVAQVLVDRGYARNVKDAFSNYLGIGTQAYVPRYKLKPEEAIAMIRKAKGVAVLAHPGAQGLFWEISRWKDAGLQGIEVYHPEHHEESIEKYTGLAAKMGLVITGGSDFHGESIKPGIGIGDWGVDKITVAGLKELFNRQIC
ncbi:PHP domain protein [Syntrophobotulus glycolicus DSM 8271]|uniref:PHP domain protein n=1 Tax=Syntrophobotulus glycolicus (strain DSM 8271 / FlGlyR) TaxID=645991 RepID=F0STX0_SYNGF|nr:PHP domain-containing protein [Syntrophobotulus glycolicus]ADY56493.1 PHP domain protein [Syntrophobotulus glycolicus DSM 8271]